MQDQRFAYAEPLDRPTQRPRPVPVTPGVRLDPVREKFLSNWRLVKRARFNAAKRFERKQNVSTIALALAGVFGFIVPFYTLMFRDVLAADLKNIMDFTASVTGALSLTIGLCEQARDYPAKARDLDVCGRRINSVLRELMVTPAADETGMRALIASYERALEECAVNHDDIDFEIARAQQAAEDGEEGEDQRRQLSALKWRERVEIYWLYVIVWMVPILFAGTHLCVVRYL